MKKIATIKLSDPIDRGEEMEPIYELNINEPRLGDLLACDEAEAGTYKEELMLLSQLSRQPKEFLQDMSVPDFFRCREVLAVVSVMVAAGMTYDDAKALIQKESGEEGPAKGEPQVSGQSSENATETWHPISSL